MSLEQRLKYFIEALRDQAASTHCGFVDPSAEDIRVEEEKRVTISVIADDLESLLRSE